MRTKQFNIKQYMNKPVMGAVAAAVVTIAAGATALAWGPDRPTYTTAAPADHVTFNSITDNPAYGDERNFLRIKDAAAGDEAYADDTQIEPGKKYTAYVYFHNNASKTLNSEAHGKKGIAQNASMRIAMPDQLKAGERTGMTGYISADNANPGTVHDDTFMTATQDLSLRYVAGSAKISSFGAVNGQAIPDSLFGSGALLGYDSLNGVLPGCNEYAGYVEFDFTAEAANFIVTKEVSKKGENNWQSNIVAKPGEEVDFRIGYDNTGTTQQNDVVVKDALPSGMSYVAGSTSLKNANVPDGAAQGDGVATNGLNIGSYTANSNAYVTLSAKVGEELEKCGVNELVNTATIITANGNKQATASVTVDVACAPGECKPGVPEGDPKCSEACVPGEGEVVDENGNCVPAALPTTGPAEVALTIAGLGVLAAAFAYWYRSRQTLKKALAGVDLEADAKAHDAPKLLRARTDTKPSDDKEDV